MASPYRALESVGLTDHGHEAVLAGWVEDVRNLGGIAFLIVRQGGGTFQAAAPLPLPVADKVGAEMDTRLDNRFLDLRKPERRAIFRVRAAALAGLREHLQR